MRLPVSETIEVEDDFNQVVDKMQNTEMLLKDKTAGTVTEPLLVDDEDKQRKQNQGEQELKFDVETEDKNDTNELAQTHVSLNTDEKPEIVKMVDARKKVLANYTMLQDAALIPMQDDILDWRLFNTQYYSQDMEYKEVEDICNTHWDRMIDVRPYMIETPFVAYSTDRLQKVLDIFRNMHLRSLPVINPGSGCLEGIITR